MVIQVRLMGVSSNIKEVSKKFRENFGGISRKLGVSRKIEGSFMGVFNGFQGYLKDVQRVFQGGFKDV